jgi:hypothetical protein
MIGEFTMLRGAAVGAFFALNRPGKPVMFVAFVIPKAARIRAAGDVRNPESEH